MGRNIIENYEGTMKNILAAILFVVLCTFMIQADDVAIKTFFTDADIQRVLNGEIVTRQYLKNNATKENTDLEIQIPRTKFADEDFGVYEMITDEKAFYPYKITDEASKLEFYNTLTAFSKLKGGQFYSRKRQQQEEVIHECYRIESSKKKKALEDETYTEIKPELTSYFLQKDSKFGVLTYRSELFNEDNNFVMVNTCTMPIAKLFFKIAGKEEYKIISYFLYDEEKEGFFYYVVFVMRIRMEFTLTKNDVLTLHPTTFSNRLRGGTVHFATLLGMDWFDKINPWDEKKLKKGYYRNY